MSSFVSTTSEISTPHPGHVWTDDQGTIRGTVWLGAADMQFTSAAGARAVAAACLECADAMDALEPGTEGP